MAEATKIFNDEERNTIQSALKLQQKSLERAARAYELSGRKSTAEALRNDLAAIAKLTHKVNTL